MKTKSRLSLLYALILFCCIPSFSSCILSDLEELQTEDVNKSMIVGTWVNRDKPSEHWKYEPMDFSGKGTGVYWITSEMSYEEAAKGPGLFQYYFNETGLMRINWMESLGSYSNPDTGAPYIIDVLNSTTMSYHSSGFSRTYTFTRQ